MMEDIVESGPQCPKCGEDEWELCNESGLAMYTDMRSFGPMLTQLKIKVVCHWCETPYTTIWTFFAQTEGIE